MADSARDEDQLMAEVAQTLTDFETSARAGRRNALPDILDVPANEGKELTLKIAALSIDDARKSDSACASPNEEEAGAAENKDSDKKQNTDSGS
ncbi:cAMP-dependent protein kinase inhibitor beta-like isoform X1 [Ptychodera flava]|uniref:cAMP-dependent protein kinase inhibitor beta-like isoform X1 n=2 Tax=Ptychodera flava TaxID=63121 RepID=UPI003969DD72